MSEAEAQVQTPIDIAAELAKGGIKTDDSPVVIPAQNTVETTDVPKPAVEEPIKEEPKVTETATPAIPQEAPATVEPPKPTTISQDTPEVKEVDWRELLKKQPEGDVMQAMGLDEKMINFLSRWRKGENLTDYLEAISVDYSKMGPEELLRRQLFKEFGGLSAEDFEEVYRMKVIEQYKLDPDIYDEKEVRRGKLLLGIDAEKARQAFMQKQQELLFSKAPEPEPSTADIELKAMQEKQEKDFETYRGFVNNDNTTKELLSTNLLKIGEGDNTFNLEITKPNEILELLYDPNKWAAKLWNADGTPNIRKQLILGAIANDDSMFFTNLAKHYEKIGAKTLAEQIQNPSEPSIGSPAKGDADGQDPIAQLAKFGTITSG